MREYVFWTDCVSTVGELINEMRNDERMRDITYQTMLRHAEGLLEWGDERGFQRRSTQGISLASDWAISYHRSFYCNVPCYYLVWSGIEYIWILRGTEDEVMECEREARAVAAPSTSLLPRYGLR